MSDDGLLGAFEEQVLLAVVRTGDDAFGMAVRRELELVTGRDVTVGAVYATLDRLEAKGLAGSRRARAAGARRIFHLTRAGARALAEARLLRERLWSGVRLEAMLA